MKRTDVRKLISNIPSRLEAIKTEVRSMAREDLDAICRIEKQRFSAPWTRFEFLAQLRKRNCGILVALEEGQTVGYLIFRRGQDFTEIQKIAVDSLHCRCGVGRTLVKSLSERIDNTTSKMTLTVPERNLNAQLFFQRLGFEAVAIVRDYVSQHSEDAYIMERDLTMDAETVDMGEFPSKTVQLIVKNAS